MHNSIGRLVLYNLAHFNHQPRSYTYGVTPPLPTPTKPIPAPIHLASWIKFIKSPVRLMRCDAKLFICAQLRMCAEDGESQTLLIISALIRMSALKNILEGLQLARSTHSAMLPQSGHRWNPAEIWRTRGRLTGRPAANSLVISQFVQKSPVHRQPQSPNIVRYFPASSAPTAAVLPADFWFSYKLEWPWFGASYACHRP